MDDGSLALSIASAISFLRPANQDEVLHLADLGYKVTNDRVERMKKVEKSGKLDEKFARRYGVISMASGIFSIALGVAALLIGGLRGAAVLGAAILVPLIAFRVSYVRSVRR